MIRALAFNAPLSQGLGRELPGLSTSPAFEPVLKWLSVYFARYSWNMAG